MHKRINYLAYSNLLVMLFVYGCTNSNSSPSQSLREKTSPQEKISSELIKTKSSKLFSLPNEEGLLSRVELGKEDPFNETQIDNNEFRADIFLKPARSINYVTLTFVATRTGVSFEEVAGRV